MIGFITTKEFESYKKEADSQIKELNRAVAFIIKEQRKADGMGSGKLTRGFDPNSLRNIWRGAIERLRYRSRGLIVYLHLVEFCSLLSVVLRYCACRIHRMFWRVSTDCTAKGRILM